MSVFYDCYHLFNVIFRNAVHDSFEECRVVVEMVGQHKLWLEVGPDAVVFGTIRSEKNLFFQAVVKINSILSILSKGIYFNIAWLITTFLTSKEQILLF